MDQNRKRGEFFAVSVEAIDQIAAQGGSAKSKNLTYDRGA
jgi:hypothetical protein